MTDSLMACLTHLASKPWQAAAVATPIPSTNILFTRFGLNTYVESLSLYLDFNSLYLAASVTTTVSTPQKSCFTLL